MPYIEVENKILTKVRGVSLGENDAAAGRQQMLKDMSKNPEHVDLIFVKGLQVYVIYNDGIGASIEWHLG